MSEIRGFRDLTTYRRARAEAKRVFKLTQRWPAEERYSLTDQIRRSSRATANLIPEAWARRRYEAAFVSKLTDALGEAMETQGWLDSALDCSYVTPQEHDDLDGAYQEIGAMINGMIQRSSTFCLATEK
ncbi:MAG TPA: four helix bundle protein [Verrucomicrobiae bacterium]|nr:four helix bundle protein [Verrucomicrobiae bacterium]